MVAVKAQRSRRGPPTLTSPGEKQKKEYKTGLKVDVVRKPLEISSTENFLEDQESAINELKQAIVHVGNEAEGEARIELQRQLFTWEVLDAVVKDKQLPM